MEYGLIGEKLGHSYSKIIQEKLIDNYTYTLHPLAKDELDLFMKEKNFKAINVTIPYKQSVIPYLDTLDVSASKIGAVNTIVNTNGVLKGYNTDYYGFAYMIEHHHIDLKDKKVLVLGCGGASKAIQAVVMDKEAKAMIITAKHPRENFIAIEEVYEKHRDVDIIINTTPVGMYPNVEATCVDLNKFENISYCIDIIYNPLNTEFALQAQSLNIPVITGLEMLVAQAKYALEYFKDIKIDDSEIDRIYKELLDTTQNEIVSSMDEVTSNKKIIHLEDVAKQTNKDIELVSKEIGLLTNMTIICPFKYHTTAILHNLKRNILKDEVIK